ncbi:MAG: SDR family NAD(P)-dependent oxidoreductase [Fusobacteriaceae bacterium]|jgi:NADP-dependent 3-hydroxy acid dehydrogenase YdfG|nr:SDR family NAD(P)-dependent oxidoreductase [Fusobacteriaceae bacterium]
MDCKSLVGGKIGLVTGATSGIGKSSAVELAKLGVNLIITGRRDSLLRELQKELETKYGVKALPLKLDVRNSGEVDSVLGALPTEWKDIDILINNAGLARGTAKVHLNSLEEIDSMVDTNVKGLLYVTRAVVPQMVARKAEGIIINIGSVAGNISYGGGAVYCGTKAAVRYISDGLRIDLVDTPIRVTNVEPGLVETEFSIVRFAGDRDKAKKVYTGIEALTPDDIALVVAYIVNLPKNIQIPEIIITPAHQADSVHKHYE